MNPDSHKDKVLQFSGKRSRVNAIAFKPGQSAASAAKPAKSATQQNSKKRKKRKLQHRNSAPQPAHAKNVPNFTCNYCKKIIVDEDDEIAAISCDGGGKNGGALCWAHALCVKKQDPIVFELLVPDGKHADDKKQTQHFCPLHRGENFASADAQAAILEKIRKIIAFFFFFGANSIFFFPN